MSESAPMPTLNEDAAKALRDALHDLEATVGLYACDCANHEEGHYGHSLFKLEHPSIANARAVLARLEAEKPTIVPGPGQLDSLLAAAHLANETPAAEPQ